MLQMASTFKEYFKLDPFSRELGWEKGKKTAWWDQSFPHLPGRVREILSQRQVQVCLPQDLGLGSLPPTICLSHPAVRTYLIGLGV